MALSQTQIVDAQTIIDNTADGDYELKVLFGDAWRNISSPTTYGKCFKEAVNMGLLRNIAIKELRSDNHHIYSIAASA